VLPMGMESLIGPNERIVGFAFLNCPGCEEVFYWLYFKQNAGGWFAETSKPVFFTSDLFVDADRVLDSLVPHADRKHFE
jgi:hypothetical protein